MFDFLKRKVSTSKFVDYPGLTVQTMCYPSLEFNRFKKGIDNVHIDVFLSPNLTTLSQTLIYELLDERSSTKRRSTDKPSTELRKKLEAFHTGYESMLIETIHCSKQYKQIDLVQLFQISVIKCVLTLVKTKAAYLLDELRQQTLKESQDNLILSKRIAWINQNKNTLLYRVTNDIFEEIKWAETGHVTKLRESLLGVTYTLPEEMLFNPLLQSPNTQDSEILMTHYVLLSPDPDSIYSFNKVNEKIDALQDEIALFIDETGVTNNVSWKDVPANTEILFNLQKTEDSLKESQESILTVQLQYQRKACKILSEGLYKAQLTLHLLAAYETERLYEHYAKLLQPYLLYKALCNEISLATMEKKLTLQLKIRPLRRKGDKPLYIKELKDTKKRIAKLARHPDIQILRQFVKDFITNRRDLNYHHLVSQAMATINLITDDTDMQLSQSNGLLYDFFEKDENPNPIQNIRNHVIIKADIRGSTTLTSTMSQRGLNPATHFARNFFDPISQLLDDFGAEKVFIEGDAVILSLFEDNNVSEHWLATARACGLAQQMLAAVHKQNANCHANNLPELELGIGICYSPAPPKFLYDDGQRIMISSAIGDADRLSSCSWKLRRKYSKQPNFNKNVMVFQQAPDDAFKGEKGMTTFRYNLNGIELHPEAFEKLKTEIALRLIEIRLPGDNYKTCFYVGTYPDIQDNTYQVVVREGKVQLWQEDSEDYPLTETLYYEVVTNQQILNSLKTIL